MRQKTGHRLIAKPSWISFRACRLSEHTDTLADEIAAGEDFSELGTRKQGQSRVSFVEPDVSPLAFVHQTSLPTSSECGRWPCVSSP